MQAFWPGPGFPPIDISPAPVFGKARWNVLSFRLRDDDQLWIGSVTFRPTTKRTTETATGKTRTLR